MSDAPPEKKESAGVPAWVMTFADLMTLLMCFFVLLLAFSEMDAAKFKELSGSMKDAFGVQTEIEVRTIPKGTSVVAREFSPGKPEPTALNEVRQFTIDSNQNSLDALERRKKDEEDTEAHAKRIRAALKDEIENGDVAVQTDGAKVIIHVLENASFDSGLADVRTQFKPVLDKIAGLIDNNSGMVTVSGHTDNVPISNARFRSNWELSTSRAVSVAHQLLQKADIDPDRFIVSGHADTRPRADNDTSDNRAKNRRVDISIVRGNELDIQQSISVEEPQVVASETEEQAL
ncbi:MAG: flagellar motor protein MotB [Woeseiaceae bacterium]